MNLSENILSMLNSQYGHETLNSLRYTQRENWCEFYGYTGAGAYFKQEARGERHHAKKVLRFINDRNTLATIQPISFDEDNNWTDFVDLFKTALEVEYGTTQALTAIYQAAQAEGDIMTVNWAAEMLEIQKNEENEYQTIIDRFSNYPASPSRNHDIDNYIKKHFVN